MHLGQHAPNACWQLLQWSCPSSVRLMPCLRQEESLIFSALRNYLHDKNWPYVARPDTTCSTQPCCPSVSTRNHTTKAPGAGQMYAFEGLRQLILQYVKYRGARARSRK